MRDFFVKLGHYKRCMEWLPILIIRITMGTFFSLSGFFKLFDAEQHKRLLETMIAAQIPFPEFHSYFVPMIELVCGVFIFIGLLTTLSSLILLFVMLVALISDRIASLATYKGISFIENFLYLPEALYVLIFFWLFFSGPNKVSFDYFIGKKK